MTPLVPIVAGLVALAAGTALLATLGPRYRVARLLATTPRVTVGEALERARSGPAGYVGVEGRIDSEQEFEDADHRPLVLRLTRLEARVRGRWRLFDFVRDAVPFEVREGLDSIAVDAPRLGDGVVVVPRESVGRVADLGDRAPRELPPEAPARLVIELVSSVEHAIVLGVPTLGPDGSAVMSEGLGRPLVLTTLERDEAMRILARRATGRVRAATFALAGGGVLVGMGLAWALVEALR